MKKLTLIAICALCMHIDADAQAKKTPCIVYMLETFQADINAYVKGKEFNCAIKNTPKPAITSTFEIINDKRKK